METIDKMPTGKIQRAGKILSTGAKVGVNYAKYYSSQLVTSKSKAREKLDQNNANDIYDSLKNLKGGALKVAQMLSMEKNILPKAYVEQFSLAQFSVPPLSPALVIKTFKNYFGKKPNKLFDSFNAESVNAASIGQVHRASKNGKELAVKIQYPGVAESIASDLSMIKPVAMKMFNIKGENSGQYFEEVRDKLMEETNYLLELENSQTIAKSCESIPNLVFPEYFPKWSSQRILTMEWMEGIHLSEFTKSNKNQELSNKIGQTLWDFYMYQIHVLKKVHADPHPGNFLISKNEELIALDFGCVKTLPESFYTPYFELSSPEYLNDRTLFNEKLLELEILKKDDNKKEREFFTNMFHALLTEFTKPIIVEKFDFDDADFFENIAKLGEKFARNSDMRKMNGNRGSRHFIYMNRTFFGLYHLMFELGAKNVEVKRFAK